MSTNVGLYSFVCLFVPLLYYFLMTVKANMFHASPLFSLLYNIFLLSPSHYSFIPLSRTAFEPQISLPYNVNHIALVPWQRIYLNLIDPSQAGDLPGSFCKLVSWRKEDSVKIL